MNLRKVVAHWQGTAGELLSNKRCQEPFSPSGPILPCFLAVPSTERAFEPPGFGHPLRPTLVVGPTFPQDIPAHRR